MGDSSSSSSSSSSPPPPPPTRSNMAMLYYGLVVIGTAAVVLALYNLIIIRWCAYFPEPWSRQGRARGAASSGWRLQHSNVVSFLSSFKYKSDDDVDGDDEDSDECAVCLSAFEEGEELRQLPKCKHSFHAPCIDMWLYSHIDCPLCRCAVEPPARRLSADQAPEMLV